MKAGQKLVHDGHEVCLFPMETMNITQWSSPQSLSHCCGHPFDNAINGQVRIRDYQNLGLKKNRTTWRICWY